MKRLQSYTVPRGVREGERGRLGLIFMDREALPASDNLNNAILRGLESSKSMIVVCSAAAAASKWVDREIQTFRRLHPSRKILPVILDAPANTHANLKRIIPAALFADDTEPLAADFRGSGDGSQLGFAKLIAALCEVPLEKLLNKESRRRNRRVTAVTSAAVLITTFMTILAVRAEAARTTAEQRRAEVEGMVDYMVSDLREQLEPVGRLDILAGVADQVNSYYQNQDARRLPCDAVVRNAHALFLETEVHLHQDKLIDAELSSQTAVELLQSKSKRCGGLPEFMVAAGHSEYWAASPIWRKVSNLERTADNDHEYNSLLNSLLSHYSRYDTAIAPLKTVPDQEDVFAQEAADNATNFGSVYYYLDRYQDARASFESAIERIAPVALIDGQLPSTSAGIASRKKALFTLANAHGWIAAVDERNESYLVALEARTRESQIARALSEQDDGSLDFRALEQALQAEMTMLRIRTRMNDPDLTMQAFTELEASVLNLSLGDPGNETWKKLLRRSTALREFYDSSIAQSK